MRRAFYPQSVRVNSKPVRVAQHRVPGKSEKAEVPVYRGLPAWIARQWRAEMRRSRRPDVVARRKAKLREPAE